MTNFKRCSTAIAVLMMSSLPALAQDGGTIEPPEQGQGFFDVTIVDGDETTPDTVRLPFGLAAQLCEEDVGASDLARSDGDVTCTIDEDDLDRINFAGMNAGGDDGEEMEDDEKTEEEREEEARLREEAKEMSEDEREENEDHEDDDRDGGGNGQNGQNGRKGGN